MCVCVSMRPCISVPVRVCVCVYVRVSVGEKDVWAWEESPGRAGVALDLRWLGSCAGPCHWVGAKEGARVRREQKD